MVFRRVDTGEDGVALFMKKNKFKAKKNISIILMDCNLPGISGYDAALEIKTLINE